ncbi:hypothetical protein TBLA_0D03800 [Henningerozyma blattae CBS 6284]|uniref:Uncharacterized protein n=1 Tax=Henningerozyma blattae (strain ATCC 34711 / CBS 6284 / DSM 70876 / NBRC 10599 / NRRL Y-10934 / UCD 77-7) TaxID=1071380 RepID=I2H3C7_HENB6|nr:hypothetical protein TBLA_0D03800 [Tetrapisispora blattae CBS 6284]CCH60879.1 hypothetical protein TBLA_0D03800 [Tetrapisispora blattae CBS 6284]
MQDDYKPCFVSFIDANNKPILVHVTAKYRDNIDNLLKFNVLSNMSLDYFESQLFEWSSLSKNRELKTLFNIDGSKVYGMLIKQTGLKIIIGFNQNIIDDEVKIIEVFELIRKIYVKTKCNPFLNIDLNGNLSNISNDDDDNGKNHNLAQLLDDRLSKELS